jgi:uncharacterized protein (TIGR02268 family)
LLAFLSMAAWAAEAEPSTGLAFQFRRVPLSATPEVVRVAPGVPLTFTFEAEIDPKALTQRAPAPVRILASGETSVTLMVSGELGKGVTLTVPLRNETLPGAVFQLVPAEGVADAQVMVFRPARAPEWMESRLTELEARSARCEAELATHRERGKATGPAAWVLAGQVDRDGVTSAALKRWSAASPAGMEVRGVRRFVARTWGVLEVEVWNGSALPWRAGRAWLEHASTGSRLEARTVDMAPEVLAQANVGRVVVEFGWQEERAPPGVFRLVVEEADGDRSLSVANVVMDDSKQEKRGP